MEILKDLPNYEGHYQVSNYGSVKSIKKKGKERIMKGGITRCYRSVSLCKNGIMRTYKVHKLVAICFLNHTPNGYESIIDHIDNNPLNNHVSNLQITTPRHNSLKDVKRMYSQFYGVSFCKRTNKWTSRYKIKKKIYYLGYFDKEIDAAMAYQNAINNLAQ
jgi:AraC-like DNA-binding protein